MAGVYRVYKTICRSRFSNAFDPPHTAVCGYSLGGLAALYALYLHSEIDWPPAYPVLYGMKTGFLFMEKNLPTYPNARIYLSLGRNEEKIPASDDAQN